MSTAITDRAYFQRYAGRNFRLRRAQQDEDGLLTIVQRIRGGVWKKLIKHPSAIATPYLADPQRAEDEVCAAIWNELAPAPRRYGFNGRTFRPVSERASVAVGE